MMELPKSTPGEILDCLIGSLKQKIHRIKLGRNRKWNHKMDTYELARNASELRLEERVYKKELEIRSDYLFYFMIRSDGLNK